MKPDSEKYDRVLKILRDSRPHLDSGEDIAGNVIKEISKEKEPVYDLSDVIDFLFGWAYIGWVRRSLVIASVLLVLFFVYQQGVILKRIDFLSRQIIVTDRETNAPADKQVEKLLMLYKRSDAGFPTRNVIMSEKQMKELIESVNELQVKYKDLEKLLEEDPKLKQLIEKKLIENNRKKVNL